MNSRRPIEATTALVTGATDGLGRSVAIALAGRGANVLVHGRDADRAEEVVAEIRKRTGSDRVELHLADFASLDEVRGLAEAVEASVKELHVLINNAGIGTGLPDSRERQESLDGHELRFAVNYLAGFLLTERLLPLLRRSAPARIVNVASLGQHPIDFDDPMITRGYSGVRAYSQSKLAQIMQAIDLAESPAAAEVTANSLHPATFMPTKIVLEEGGKPLDSLELGTRAVVRLAVDPELDGVNGRFFDRLEEGAAHPQAYDPRARAELRRLSEELVGPRLS
ncbi:MAG: short-chain dehydrogenase/reductase [Solirubrobacterales bacterium]|nr:short-chain dehydrogenase/reductase [Solirubrobacterales bacterium]